MILKEKLEVLPTTYFFMSVWCALIKLIIVEIRNCCSKVNNTWIAFSCGVAKIFYKLNSHVWSDKLIFVEFKKIFFCYSTDTFNSSADVMNDRFFSIIYDSFLMIY